MAAAIRPGRKREPQVHHSRQEVGTRRLAFWVSGPFVFRLQELDASRHNYINACRRRCVTQGQEALKSCINRPRNAAVTQIEETSMNPQEPSRDKNIYNAYLRSIVRFASIPSWTDFSSPQLPARGTSSSQTEAQRLADLRVSRGEPHKDSG